MNDDPNIYQIEVPGTSGKRHVIYAPSDLTHAKQALRRIKGIGGFVYDRAIITYRSIHSAPFTPFLPLSA